MSEYICNTEDKCGMCEAYRTSEPIVRCRDCEHFTSHKEFYADIEVGFPLIIATVDTCDFWADTECKVEPDGFCAWASRKEDA